MVLSVGLILCFTKFVCPRSKSFWEKTDSHLAKSFLTSFTWSEFKFSLKDLSNYNSEKVATSEPACIIKNHKNHMAVGLPDECHL